MLLVLDQPGGSLLVMVNDNRVRMEAGKPVEVDDIDVATGLVADPTNNIREYTKPPPEPVEAPPQVEDDEANDDPATHKWVSDRGGVNCIMCGKPEPGHLGYVPPPTPMTTPPASGAITTSDLSKGGRRGGSRKKKT